jgi:Stress responsive A/B Barrel Domain
MPLENIFIHHVYFWLKNPGSDADLAELTRGLKKLSGAKIIKQFHIGRPADTDRDVIDHSYSLSWLLIFENAADQASYQTDPMHLQFVDDCSHLWGNVIVYDTVDL